MNSPPYKKSGKKSDSFTAAAGALAILPKRLPLEVFFKNTFYRQTGVLL
jgi:hypothetical protein